MVAVFLRALCDSVRALDPRDHLTDGFGFFIGKDADATLRSVVSRCLRERLCRGTLCL